MQLTRVPAEFRILLLTRKDLIEITISVNKNNYSFPIQEGFTLIEILIVLSLIGLLTSLGMASYSSYNATQIVASNASNVETLLTEAHSQAISQVIPASCGSNTLSGYEVDVTLNGQIYTLSAVCGSKQLISTNTLPPQVTFANGSTASVVFNAETGIISNPSAIIITGYGQTHTVSINTTGDVSMN